MIKHLTNETCQTLRTNCERNFTNEAIKEIVSTISESKKGKKATFKQFFQILHVSLEFKIIFSKNIRMLKNIIIKNYTVFHN